MVAIQINAIYVHIPLTSYYNTYSGRDSRIRYGVIKKMATQHVTSTRVPVPGHWIDRKVGAVRIDPENENNK